MKLYMIPWTTGPCRNQNLCSHPRITEQKWIKPFCLAYFNAYCLRAARQSQASSVHLLLEVWNTCNVQALERSGVVSRTTHIYIPTRYKMSRNYPWGMFLSLQSHYERALHLQLQCSALLFIVTDKKKTF